MVTLSILTREQCLTEMRNERTVLFNLMGDVMGERERAAYLNALVASGQHWAQVYLSNEDGHSSD